MLINLAGCNDSDPPISPAIQAGEVPLEYHEGQTSFNRFCSSCHGLLAAGSQKGPTFIQRVYEPGHHGDQSFLRAARMGVRAHHWKFGDMPPVEGVTDAEISEIIAYVRWLQRQAGIH